MSFKQKLKAAFGIKDDPCKTIAKKIQQGEKQRVKDLAKAEVICDYCGNPAKKVTGEEVYPHRYDLWDLKFFVCEPCEARVGCHKKSEEPYGRLSNKYLRQAKMDTHKAFDELWKGPCKIMSRDEAYEWLADILGISRDEAHIGKFNLETCRKVTESLKDGGW